MANDPLAAADLLEFAAFFYNIAVTSEDKSAIFDGFAAFSVGFVAVFDKFVAIVDNFLPILKILKQI